jgi:hypothetical protein
MASGHVNRANRPNTWLLRPTPQREDSPCQPGAVHTWPNPVLLWDHRVRPLPEDKRTRFARRETFRV